MKFKKKLVLPLAVLLTCAAPLYAYCPDGYHSPSYTTQGHDEVIRTYNHSYQLQNCYVQVIEHRERRCCSICSAELSDIVTSTREEHSLGHLHH